MNKGNHSIQQDENLREALRQEEAALPQMPADLNDRLMKRLHHERRQRHYRAWPWLAAACVATVMVVWLLPPKEKGSEAVTGSGELTAQTSSIATEQDSRMSQQETTDTASPTTVRDGRMTDPAIHDSRVAKMAEQEPRAKTKAPRLLTQPSATIAKATPKKHGETVQNTKVLLAQEETADQPKNVTASGEIVPADLPRSQAKPQQMVLTERDIPISRPENYRYTPEEIALMRRQANEAYVKWMELEMEIAKHQLEQIAKQ